MSLALFSLQHRAARPFFHSRRLVRRSSSPFHLLLPASNTPHAPPRNMSVVPMDAGQGLTDPAQIAAAAAAQQKFFVVQFGVPILIATTLSCFFAGLVLSTIFTYFSRYGKSDRWAFRILVGYFLFALLGDTGTQIAWCYGYTITSQLDPASVLLMPKCFAAYTVLTCVVIRSPYSCWLADAYREAPSPSSQRKSSSSVSSLLCTLTASRSDPPDMQLAHLGHLGSHAVAAVRVNLLHPGWFPRYVSPPSLQADCTLTSVYSVRLLHALRDVGEEAVFRVWPGPSTSNLLPPLERRLTRCTHSHSKRPGHGLEQDSSQVRRRCSSIVFAHADLPLLADVLIT